MTAQQDYWKECIAQAAEECALTLSDEQLDCLASAAEIGHEHYSMAFYQPSVGDYESRAEREWKEKCAELEKRLRDQEDITDKAIRRLGRIRDGAIIKIDKHGYVEVL